MTQLESMFTISQAAELFGVTRQRMHQLILAYNVETVVINDRCKLVDVMELAKIPTVRPWGVRKKK